MRVIFHTPLPLREGSDSGSGVRPMQMRRALAALGHEIWEISGYQRERQRSIRKIRQAVRHGLHFDACYSELSTQAITMTEPHNLPLRPFMDFRFFAFLRRHRIPVGAFYRDVHWRFPNYAPDIPWWQTKAALSQYLFELRGLHYTTDVVFVPSAGMIPYVTADINPSPKSLVNRLRWFGSGLNLVPLPPGHGVSQPAHHPEPSESGLRLFYVGGLGPKYRLHQFFAAVQQLHSEGLPIHLDFVCREEDWQAQKHEYEAYLNPAISIHHASGTALQQYYDRCNLGVIAVEPREYWRFAVPVKMFEYLGQGKPVLVSRQTYAASWIESQGCGWVVDYNREALATQLRYLHENPQAHSQVRDIALRVRADNSWRARAQQALNYLLDTTNQ